jgi:hypothetical protein
MPLITATDPRDTALVEGWLGREQPDIFEGRSGKSHILRRE